MDASQGRMATIQRGAEDERMRRGNISSRLILDAANVCFHFSDVLLNSM